MNDRLVALCIAILGAMVFVPSAQAQRRVASAPTGRPGTAVARRGGVKTRFVRQSHGRRFSSDSAFAPYFYPDYDSEPETVDAPPAQIIEQTAEPASAVPVPNTPGALVLELQDDHWVRITNSGQSQTGGQSSQPQSEQAPIYHRPATPRRIPAAGSSERASARRARVSRWAQGRNSENT